MALEHLVAALEGEAEAKIGAILGAAREEAAQLEAEAAGLVARHLATTLEARRFQLQQETERLIAAARREARQKLLLARHQLLDRVLHRALDLAADETLGAGYLAALPAELALALDYVGSTATVVTSSSSLARNIRPLLENRPEVKLEVSRVLAPGFQVVAADRSVVVDRTLPRRLQQEEARLRQEILQELERS
jgi:vacuolar-type H+-ATPase subunit E/Vma4